MIMRLVRDQLLIFADLGDLKVLIASFVLLSDRAGEGLTIAAFAVKLEAVFTGKGVIEIVQGVAQHLIRWKATHIDTITS